jgi:hypothetical protein
MIDYIARMGYEVRDDPEGTRVLFEDRSALFPNLAGEEVRGAVNRAMETALSYFTVNVSKSTIAIEPRQVEEVAFRVTVSWIAMYNSWRNFYPEHRNHSLSVSEEELRQPRTFDQCYDYCKAVFGPEFRKYVAALLGLSEKQFARTEERREKFWNR